MGQVNVFLTVDIEASIGGAFRDPKLKPVGSEKRIFGRVGEREYGLPLILEIAENCGLKVTGFLEVFNKYFFGEREAESVCRYLLQREHDVQLHIHPNYLNFTLERPGELRFSDFMSAYPLERQVEMLEEGREMLCRFGAPRPQAFRAGSYAANEETLKALATAGFAIDSSYNAAFLEDCCHLPESAINDAAAWNGSVTELPVTVFRDPFGRSRRIRPFDLNGAGFEEMKTALLDAAARGMQSVTVVLHSFSFIKAFDVQYRRVRIRRNVIARFERLCRFLAENPDSFRVRTLGEMTRPELEAMHAGARHHIPGAGLFGAARRLGEQIWDRWA